MAIKILVSQSNNPLRVFNLREASEVSGLLISTSNVDVSTFIFACDATHSQVLGVNAESGSVGFRRTHGRIVDALGGQHYHTPRLMFIDLTEARIVFAVQHNITYVVLHKMNNEFIKHKYAQRKNTQNLLSISLCCFR